MASYQRSLPEISADLRRLMAEVGPRWGESVAKNVDLMIGEFSKVLAQSPREGVTVHRDVRYGEHDRHAFDVFMPETMLTPPPLVLFMHGGAFVSGHRNRSDQIYSNVLYFLARHGIAGINIGYRLAHHATYPAAIEDVAGVVAWAHHHASEFGWNPAKLFLMGHSAGAAHAAAYAYDTRWHPMHLPKLAGMIVVSGRVRIDNLPENPNAGKVEVYYGSDASKFDSYSPVAHVDKDSVPTFVAWAEFENPLIDVYCAELVYRLAHAKRKAPPSMWLSGHNHTSSIGQIGTSDNALGEAIVDFVHNPR